MESLPIARPLPSLSDISDLITDGSGVRALTSGDFALREKNLKKKLIKSLIQCLGAFVFNKIDRGNSNWKPYGLVVSSSFCSLVSKLNNCSCCFSIKVIKKLNFKFTEMVNDHVLIFYHP